MSARILFVDDSREILAVLERQLGGEFEVETACGAEAALEALHSRGPFAVVVSDHSMPGMKGSQLLARVHERWPDTVKLMLTGQVDVDVAIEALHAGRIFRFLEKPCPKETLRAALAAALEEHGRRRGERRQTDELSFTTQILTRFNDELGRRIAAQNGALARLHRFVGDLNSCDSLEEIAEHAARTAHEVCGRRAVLVELWGRDAAEGRSRASAGGNLSMRRHVQPVEAQEGQLGTISIDREEPSPLTRADRGMLASIACSTAVAVANELRRRERDEVQHAMILALAKLAEQRDNETGKHLERVSLYSRLVAEGLREAGWYAERITDGFLRDLVRSAPLHDIGKVGIPDQILLKPGKLSQQEWEIMKTHCDIGAETLKSVMRGKEHHRFLEMSMQIAWCHHEKWDGNGYPRGLRGEDIPLCARILTLADVYDALTTVRPYKGAWTHADAVAWIARGAGTHFDPRAVEVFVQRAPEADLIRTRLADSDEDLERLRARSAAPPADAA